MGIFHKMKWVRILPNGSKEPLAYKPVLDISKIIGYLGLILLQCNFVPAIYEAINTGVKMSVTSLTLYVVALSCFLYNSIKEKNTLYIWSNIFGVVGNAILLTLAIIK
jgi:hypothetical protein